MYPNAEETQYQTPKHTNEIKTADSRRQTVEILSKKPCSQHENMAFLKKYPNGIRPIT